MQDFVSNEQLRSRAWDIVRAYGRTSQARYALFDDKSFFFATGGTLVSYVHRGRVALVLGDPIGPADNTCQAILEFREFCSNHGWLTAFYQVLPDHVDVYKSLGFYAMTLGHEAIVDLAKFSLHGSENKTLRNSYNKLSRCGYQAEVIQPPFSLDMLRELRSISDDWLIGRGFAELRFSVGWFDEAYLNTCPVVLVRSRAGRIEAFANLVTEFQADEIAVDLMRYCQNGEPGVMDFLFVSVFLWAYAQGFSSFNLGLSPFSGMGEKSDEPALERAFGFIFHNTHRWQNFRGLHFFKEKFHPVWSPRYLIYPGRVTLPLVGAAFMRAIARKNTY
ncbi:MAG: phosphatidylglycerol lysyltransferase domain-containing protein [Chloroflexota bacterium]